MFAGRQVGVIEDGVIEERVGHWRKRWGGDWGRQESGSRIVALAKVGVRIVSGCVGGQGGGGEGELPTGRLPCFFFLAEPR
jgi:hypothetical protein